MQILVVDFETSGLDSEHNAPLSVGWVLLSDTLTQVRYGEALIQPFAGAIIDPKALGFNKLDIEICGQRGKTEEEILDMLEHQTLEYERSSLPVTSGYNTKTLWAGQNPKFDWGFYQAMLRRAKRDTPRNFDYHLLDTFSMGFSPVWQGSVSETAKKSKLEGLVKEAGVLLRTPHQALADAMATAEVIRRSLLGLWGLDLDPYRIGVARGKESVDTETLKEGDRLVPRHS